jgi:hypothetical protein
MRKETTHRAPLRQSILLLLHDPLFYHKYRFQAFAALISAAICLHKAAVLPNLRSGLKNLTKSTFTGSEQEP